MNDQQFRKRVSVNILVLFLSSIISVIAADPGSMSECESRCQPLAGEERYRCIKTCLSSKRRNEPVNEARGQGTYKECEASCSSLTGLENVQCIRKCMEYKRPGPPVKKDARLEKPAAASACESRCDLLTGELRDKCLARCKKDKYNDYRDPLRVKK
jgi:hypothetical protein